MKKLFADGPAIIAALHLPDITLSRDRSIAWLEEYAITNARVFAEAGIPWLKLQDQVRSDGRASAESIAVTTSLARLIRREVPQIGIGIIVEAHDPVAPLAIAHASGADFVRLKVFVGGAMTAQGPRYGLGAEAVQYRAGLGREEIAILADVHDRTAMPISGESQVFAAEWAVKTGADGLVITGHSFDDTLSRISALRKAGNTRPILIGGSVTEANVGTALEAAQGVVVSTALMKPGSHEGDMLRWDRERCLRLMDAACAVPA
ncbi:BtpA/SgcQ family protein [Maricaulis maris]|uniref:BtpA/SgcQ family protein n=1 Tax=Maricaulis maris TaxID=74318 RepID=UPI003A8F66E5